jgi:hypothetical protein
MRAVFGRLRKRAYAHAFLPRLTQTIAHRRVSRHRGSLKAARPGFRGSAAQGLGVTRALTIAVCIALLAPFTDAAPASAANTLTPWAYLEYSGVYGDTYNGVTTDDGDHLSSSYSAKARVYYGRFAASVNFYRDVTDSQTNATTVSGAPGTVLNYPGGQVIVPVFTAVDAASEIRLEYQPARLPVYFGLAYSNASNNYNFPRLTALGVGVELMPNLRHLLSPFGSFFFFPNQTGTYPLGNPNNPNSGSVGSAFRSNELELGGSLVFPKTDLSLVAGYYQTTNIRRTGTFNFVRDGPFVGLGLRLR